MKYWNDNWKKIVFAYLDRIIDQGFCGVYLDKVDAFEYWSDPDNGEDVYLSEEEAAERMISFIKEITDYCRNSTGNDFYVIPQNGERLIEYDNTILDVISGWAVEDLFYDGLNPIPSSTTRERVHYLDIIRNAGKPVFVVDYVDDESGYTGSNKERIDDFRAKTLAKGYIPYVARSDRELDELNVIEGSTLNFKMCFGLLRCYVYSPNQKTLIVVRRQRAYGPNRVHRTSNARRARGVFS